MSIRTVRTDGIACSQSAYDPKMGLSHLTCVKGFLQIMSIRTVRTDRIGRFQSVYDPKMELRIYFTSYLCQGGLTDHVHPYGPYRWNRPFSIRIRSENCVSLMGLRIDFTSYPIEGFVTGCRSVRSVLME